MTGIELIAKERQEQIEKHGFTIIGDVDANSGSELIGAAEGTISAWGEGNLMRFPLSWGEELCRRILNKPLIERLAIAGALLAAEIDRLQYIEENKRK